MMQLVSLQENQQSRQFWMTPYKNTLRNTKINGYTFPENHQREDCTKDLLVLPKHTAKNLRTV